MVFRNSATVVVVTLLCSQALARQADVTPRIRSALHMAVAIKKNPRASVEKRLPLMRLVSGMKRRERLIFASKLLGHPLTRDAKRSLMRAHRLKGKDRIRRKARTLTNHFTRREIRLLMATSTTGVLDRLNAVTPNGLWENPSVRAERKGQYRGNDYIVGPDGEYYYGGQTGYYYSNSGKALYVSNPDALPDYIVPRW